jgi:hypothetical protein
MEKTELKTIALFTLWYSALMLFNYNLLFNYGWNFIQTLAASLSVVFLSAYVVSKIIEYKRNKDIKDIL